VSGGGLRWISSPSAWGHRRARARRESGSVHGTASASRGVKEGFVVWKHLQTNLQSVETHRLRFELLQGKQGMGTRCFFFLKVVFFRWGIGKKNLSG